MIDVLPITEPRPPITRSDSGDSMTPIMPPNLPPTMGNDFVITGGGNYGGTSGDYGTSGGSYGGNYGGTSGGDYGTGGGSYGDYGSGTGGGDYSMTGGGGYGASGGGDYGNFGTGGGYSAGGYNTSGSYGNIMPPVPIAMPGLPGNIPPPGSNPGSLGNFGFVGGSGVPAYPISTPAPSNLCGLPQSNMGNLGTNLLGGMLPPNQMNNNTSGMMQLMLSGMQQMQSGQNTQFGSGPGSMWSMGSMGSTMGNPFSAGPVADGGIFALPGVPFNPINDPMNRQINFTGDNGMIREMNFTGDNGMMRVLPPVVNPEARRMVAME